VIAIAACCEALHVCYLGYPMETKLCFDHGTKAMADANFTKRMCD